jgi:hypothetical protein
LVLRPLPVAINTCFSIISDKLLVAVALDNFVMDINFAAFMPPVKLQALKGIALGDRVVVGQRSEAHVPAPELARILSLTQEDL